MICSSAFTNPIYELYIQIMNPTNLTKRGMHTSKDIAQANTHSYQVSNPQQITQTRKEYIVTNIESSKPNIVINKAYNLTTDQLNQTKYINSLGIQNGRPQFHFNYNNVAHSNFVPPPPSKFLVSSGYNHSMNSQTSQLPINSNHVQTVQNIQTFQPLHQSIRKTYVPHHIYNEIPIMNTQTKYVEAYRHQSSAQQGDQNQFDEGQAKMLEQYQKLYHKYEQQCIKTQTLQRRIKDLQQQLVENEYQGHSSQPQIKQVIRTKEVYVNRPGKVDINLLASLIMKKLKPQITNSFERKKASCINKLKSLINDHQSAIKTTMIRSYDQVSVKVQNR